MQSINPLAQRNNQIDGLRAFSFFLVFLYHAGYLEAGYIGVDLFFILSGYLMTSSIISTNNAEGKKGAVTFIQKRMARLLPSMLVLIIFTITLSYMLVPDSDRNEILRTALTILIASTNYYLAFAQDYFGMSAMLNPFTHMWSISAEIHFYLIIAVLGFLFNFRLLGWVIIFFVLLYLSIFIGGESSQTYLFSHTRIVSFFFGSAVYFISIKKSYLYESTPLMLIALYSILFLSSCIKFPAIIGGSDWLLNSIIANVIGMAILFNIVNSKHVGENLLPFFSQLEYGWSYIGRISYSLYLFHFPLISFTFWLWGDINILSLFIILISSIFISAINYNFVESRYFSWSLSKKNSDKI